MEDFWRIAIFSLYWERKKLILASVKERSVGNHRRDKLASKSENKQAKKKRLFFVCTVPNLC